MACSENTSDHSRQPQFLVPFLVTFSLLAMGAADTAYLVESGNADSRPRVMFGAALAAWALAGLLVHSASGSSAATRARRLYLSTCVFAFFSGVLAVVESVPAFLLAEAAVSAFVISSVCVDVTYGRDAAACSRIFYAACAQAVAICVVMVWHDVTVSFAAALAALIGAGALLRVRRP